MTSSIKIYKVEWFTGTYTVPSLVHHHGSFSELLSDMRLDQMAFHELTLPLDPTQWKNTILQIRLLLEENVLNSNKISSRSEEYLKINYRNYSPISQSQLSQDPHLGWCKFGLAVNKKTERSLSYTVNQVPKLWFNKQMKQKEKADLWRNTF